MITRGTEWFGRAAPLVIVANAKRTVSMASPPRSVSPWVRSASTATGAVLLDLRRSRWVGLNASGTAVWSALRSGQSVGTVTDSLSRSGIDRKTVFSDVARFVLALESAGFVTVGHGVDSHVTAEPRSVESLTADDVVVRRADSIIAAGLIVVSWVLLRLIGLERIVTALERRSARPRTSRMAQTSQDGGIRFLEVVAATSRASLLRSPAFLCLERSLAAVLWCRLRGIPAQWCLGASSPPFAAHAWAELDGISVVGSRAAEFVPVLRA